MAFSPKTLLTLVALLVLATSQAHGLTIGGAMVTAVGVNVTMNCQANPAGPVTATAAPLANVPVVLRLFNLIPLATATTNVNGTTILNVTSAAILGLVPNVPALSVAAALPIPVCPLLANTTGILVGAVQTVGTIINNVLNLNVPLMTIQAP